MTPDITLSSVRFVYKIYLMQLMSASVCVCKRDWRKS